MRNILMLASAAALAAVSSPSLAADTATRTVAYGDLDLGKTAGVSALKQRVRSAAAAVCGTATAPDIATSSRVRACVSNAMNDAEKSVDRAIRTARGA